MIRLVLDTNVIISAALSPTGQGAFILALASRHLVQLFVSTETMAEYVDVIKRVKVGVDIRSALRVLRTIEELATVVRPGRRVAACLDSDDNIFLECAEAAKAHYLITENVRHFPKTWKYTRVLRPGQFLKLWETQKPLGL